MLRLIEELNTLPLEKRLDLQTAEYPDDDWWWNEEDYDIARFDLPYLNSIMAKLGMTKTRIMRMPPASTYHFHTDNSPRIHIPVQTNRDNIFIIEDEIYRLEEGRVYWVDTTRPHNFVNGSLHERIHIVGAVNVA